MQNAIAMEHVTDAIELMCRTKRFELPREMGHVQNEKLNTLLRRYNDNQKEQQQQQARPHSRA